MYQPPQQFPYEPPPRKMSTWTIVLIVLGGCAVVGTAGVAVLAALLFPVFSRAREAARKVSCMSNVKQLSMALRMYSQDYDEKLPPAAVWQVAAGKYGTAGGALLCPSRPGVANAYAYNVLLSRRALQKVSAPAQTPMLFESSLNVPNAADKLQSFVKPHRSAGIVAFVDGRVLAMSAPPHATAGLASRRR